MPENKKHIELDPHKEYLKEKFDELIDIVGEGYGKPLQDELIWRLEKTVKNFHVEVTDLITTLKEQSKLREDKLKNLFHANAESTSAASTSESQAELSDWEKKLEEREKSKKKSSPKISKKTEKKKKGMFGRKKS